MGSNRSNELMWGGRFEQGPAEAMKRINASARFDQRFWREDIEGSQAHARMLVRQGVITPELGDDILRGLTQIGEEIVAGSFEFTDDLEDVHTNIEARLRELIGPGAGALHTGRSRNDQVATDLRLWVRRAIATVDLEAESVQRALIAQADRHTDTIMPGFTHMQVAQPITFGHHLLAYVEMVGRDRQRLADCARRADACPLGAAGLAGTAYPLDRHWVAEALGFSRPTENSLDSVASRDHVAELLFAFAMMSVHLSRLAEEIVIWTSPGFGFVRLSDAYTTGSSIFPQKRNPDAAELIRGKSGRMVGDLTALLVMLKSLPLAFMKDLQEDKEPLFDAFDNIHLCLQAMAGMVQDMTAEPDRMRAFLTRGYPTATDLADWLVRELHLPFREAHHITGRLVAMAEARGCALEGLSLEELRSVESRIHEGLYEVLSIEASVRSRNTYGGTSPDQVRDAVSRARAAWLRE